MINIIFNNIKIITANNNKLIINLLESQNMIFKSQCRIGICGFCKCFLLSGNIQYISTPLAFSKNKNEIFICIAKPLTSINIVQ